MKQQQPQLMAEYMEQHQQHQQRYSEGTPEMVGQRKRPSLLSEFHHSAPPMK